MRITEIEMLTADLESIYTFYKRLGFDIKRTALDRISFQVGWTTIYFKQTDHHIPYHYCFLIPKNKLHEALNWIKPLTPIIKNADNSEITHFENWNADSFYFWDTDKNLVEFIVRHDLEYTAAGAFDSKQILCLNEIGLPTTDITATQRHFSSLMGTTSWKGNNEIFGTHGDQEGLLLMPNPLKKENWYPTKSRIEIGKVKLQLEANGKMYSVSYPMP